MGRDRDGADSFDPRTWGGSARSSTDGALRRGRPAKIVEPVAGKPRVASVRTAPAVRATGASSAATLLPVAFGVSALLLVAGGATARFVPSAAPSPPPVATAAAAPGPTAAATAAPDRTTLVVADPTQIASRLRSAGVAAAVADGAAQEVGSVLGQTGGDIQLVIDLTGPDAARDLTRLEATRDSGGVVLTAMPDGSYRSEPTQRRTSTGM